MLVRAGSRRRLVGAPAPRVEHPRTERELYEQAARPAERAAIAAGMHAVLAHRLGPVTLHTGVPATRGESLPDPVSERTALLRTASTDAPADLHDDLGALRDPDARPAAAAPAYGRPDTRFPSAAGRSAGAG
ncbi:hypothetical protein [Streptomyces enissocaesilis]|uniref:Uncharacterized protein n=1 Tax=Streptomyces enissocaesilis TaxID=332589 RepID=A0ABP6JM06_9ACTN